MTIDELSTLKADYRYTPDPLPFGAPTIRRDVNALIEEVERLQRDHAAMVAMRKHRIHVVPAESLGELFGNKTWFPLKFLHLEKFDPADAILAAAKALEEKP